MSTIPDPMQQQKTKRGALLHHALFHGAILVLFALICYSNTFRVPFVFDDLDNIENNPVIRSLGNFFANASGYEFNGNRYVGTLSFAFNYHFGGLDVVGYHIANLAIHIVTALLLYALLRLTFRTPFFAALPAGSQPAALIPFFAALLFVCHPLQTEAVTYIYQRVASLATLFYLAALVLHICWRLAYAGGKAVASPQVLIPYLLSLLCALLAMKTKEIAFTLPLVALLYEYCFFGKPSRRLLLLLAPLAVTMLVIPLTMVDLHRPAGAILAEAGSATRPGGDPLPRWNYLLTQFSVIVTYLRLLVLPVHQNLDYDYPLTHSLLEPRAFLSLALLLAIIALALRLWRRSGASPEAGPLPRLASFGILWFFITLAVESSLVPISDFIFEHRVYLPSAGFFMAATSLLFCGAARFGAHLPAVRTIIVLLSLSALVLSAATYRRNMVWESVLSLWEDVKKKSPKKFRAHNEIGVYHAKQGRLDEAVQAFTAAVRLNRKSADARFNLAQAYYLAGRYGEAIEQFEAGLRLKPDEERAVVLLQEIRREMDRQAQIETTDGEARP
ncbi:tetratricopeptide repeat protein [Geobacter sp. FeAm09]|uniref:tetratricopeptide repeat protein n=1 Tax=Geobacter sp. FeAm09 TaxID=2597769 RepID=UPI00143CFB04|nr:tetratricopeptide repeat protein [Geobacter sp. FeAm09]